MLHAHAAGALKDAVGVCAREMGDPQLALFLARLLDAKPSTATGSGPAAPGPLLQGVITTELLPGALSLESPTLLPACSQMNK
jgi:RAVE protein 1 C terminal